MEKNVQNTGLKLHARKSCRDNHDKKYRVSYYARVSTFHTEQSQSLSNQVEWAYDVDKENDNWEMYKIYQDQASGTQIKNRDGFLEALQDAKNREYDILCVRDVSRFARSVKLSIEYVSLLREYDVEVVFLLDKIYTFEAGSDFQLQLYSIFSENEARKISERTRAGMEISMNKGTVFGSGNLLGMTLCRPKLLDPSKDSSSNYYKIEDEGAQTVRMIFDMYVNKNYGMKRISSELMRLHRKNASGLVKWDPSRVSRILDIRTYSGFRCYNKSFTETDLSHKRKKHNKDDYIYVKDSEHVPEIIPDEIWQKAQEIKKSRTITVNETMKRGKNISTDKWTNKLQCSCANHSSYKRYRWRVNKSGEDVIGYSCYSKTRYNGIKFAKQNGLDTSDFCEIKAISRWKLEVQIKKILNHVCSNSERIVSEIAEAIENAYVPDKDINNEIDVEKLQRKRERIVNRRSNLLDLFLDGGIDKETYNNRRELFDKEITEIDNQLKVTDIEDTDEKQIIDKNKAISDIKNMLREIADLDAKFINPLLIDKVVYKVIPYPESEFKWYINLSGDKEKTKDSDFVPFWDFEIGFEEARAYRRRYGNFIRFRDWEDIKCKVFIKV